MPDPGQDHLLALLALPGPRALVRKEVHEPTLTGVEREQVLALWSHLRHIQTPTGAVEDETRTFWVKVYNLNGTPRERVERYCLATGWVIEGQGAMKDGEIPFYLRRAAGVVKP